MRKLFIFVISFFLMPVVFSQSEPLPEFKHRYFKLDSSIIIIPDYHFNENWENEYLNSDKSLLNILQEDNDLTVAKLLPDFSYQGNMPVYYPEIMANMPVHVPDKSTHFHMQVKAIKPIPLINANNIDD